MHASAFISRANGGIRPPGATPTARIIYTNSFPFSPHPPTTPYNHPCSVADTPEGVLARRGRCWWRRDDAGLHHRGLREWPTPGDKWGRTGCRTVPVLPAAVRAPGVLAQHAMGWTWMVSPMSCPTGFSGGIGGGGRLTCWTTMSGDKGCYQTNIIPSAQQSGRVREQKPPNGALKGVTYY